MKIAAFVCMLMWSATAFGQSKTVCITVDDLPAVTYGDTTQQTKTYITNQLVQFFAANQMPAVGFVNEGKL